MKKDILWLIKKAGASRNFKSKEIPDKLLDRIIEAGRWGLSILGVQPWKIVCVKRRDLIEKIAEEVANKSKEIGNPFATILRLTSITISNSRALIVMYDNNRVLQRVEKYGEPYKNKAKIAEIQAIGGAIQNMILETYSLCLGCVWMDSPAFFNEKEINRILKQDNELIAILGIGYPSKKINRSARTDHKKIVNII